MDTEHVKTTKRSIELFIKGKRKRAADKANHKAKVAREKLSNKGSINTKY